MTDEACRLRRRIRWLLMLFILGLLASGATAMPLAWEVTLLHRWVHAPAIAPAVWPPLAAWLDRVFLGVTTSSAQYPFLAYGTDWLAFGHFVIAIAFVGPLRDPVRNRWVVDFGLIACVLVLPLALIMGPLRGIPPFWRGIDCAFGVAGFVPLWLCRRYIDRLEAPASR